MEWHKEKYRKDPEYRAKVIKETRERHLVLMKNPLYVKLKRARTRIYNYQQRIDYHLKLITNLEKRLIQWVKKKEELEREYKLSKAKSNGTTARVHRGIIH